MKELLAYLYLIGQVLEIVGASLLFVYGLPPFMQRIPLSQFDYSGLEPEKIAEDAKYKKRYKLGFLLILFGFLLNFPFNVYTAWDAHQSKNNSPHHSHCHRHKY